MRIEVNGVRIFFDVEGAKLVPDGPRMREKPTLILLHGGPGQDHSPLKMDFHELVGGAQVIYMDLRGNGRSEQGNPSRWNLKQWAADLETFLRRLDIEHPIIYGESFGGIVALQFAVLFPDIPRKLVLSSTRGDECLLADRVDVGLRIGGSRFEGLARSWLVSKSSTDMERIEKAIQALGAGDYRNDDAAARMERNPSVLDYYGKHEPPIDLLPLLGGIRCPVLVLHGEDDPVVPVLHGRRLAKALPQELVTYREFAGCRHIVQMHERAEFLDVVREFIAGDAS